MLIGCTAQTLSNVEMGACQPSPELACCYHELNSHQCALLDYLELIAYKNSEIIVASITFQILAPRI